VVEKVMAGFEQLCLESPMSSRISDLVKTVVADRKITKAEWEGQLKGEFLNEKRASPETRELLETWANDGFEAEDGVRADMRNVLRGAGYDISSTVVPKADVIPGIIESNMTEVDSDFEALIQLAGRNDAKTTIAVLDGGFQIDHPAFVDKEWTNPGEIDGNDLDDDKNGLVDDVHGWDFAGGDKDVSGGDHGTHVSGTATRGTNRIEEIACRAFEPLDPAKVADAIDYACKNGARVINMSFKVDDEKEVELVKAAMERHPDVLFVKSAGNDGNLLVEGKSYGGYYGNDKTYGTKSYLPMASIPNMIVVAAADAKGERADYSNHAAPWVTVAMRGSEVYSSVPGNLYESMDGTSMASPNVTAVIAKCLALAPSLTPADVRKILIDTTDQKDSWKGLCESGGLVNQGRATRLAALIELVKKGGVEPEAAATKLKLEGEDRARLLGMLASYPV
jgi:subtilisin family serine protease